VLHDLGTSPSFSPELWNLKDGGVKRYLAEQRLQCGLATSHYCHLEGGQGARETRRPTDNPDTHVRTVALLHLEAGLKQLDPAEPTAGGHGYHALLSEQLETSSVVSNSERDNLSSNSNDFRSNPISYESLTDLVNPNNPLFSSALFKQQHNLSLTISTDESAGSAKGHFGI